MCVDLLKSGETGLAGELLRKLVDVDPADSVAHYYLGLIPEAKGEPANAIYHYDRSRAVEARTALQRLRSLGQ
ncbi:TPA: hypothetical protein DCE37_11195 [Candidatus Latescibacteria bacterium]|nr:hypothetical protein [Candidatus Latescibacterota bacterium]